MRMEIQECTNEYSIPVGMINNTHAKNNIAAALLSNIYNHKIRPENYNALLNYDIVGLRATLYMRSDQRNNNRKRHQHSKLSIYVLDL